jgi:hypothetical protein
MEEYIQQYNAYLTLGDYEQCLKTLGKLELLMDEGDKWQLNQLWKPLNLGEVSEIAGIHGMLELKRWIKFFVNRTLYEYIVIYDLPNQKWVTEHIYQVVNGESRYADLTVEEKAFVSEQFPLEHPTLKAVLQEGEEQINYYLNLSSKTITRAFLEETKRGNSSPLKLRK